VSIELNWATFRRLVQLELAALLLLFPVGVLELFIPGYHQLDQAFERQAADYGFREAPAAVALAIFLTFLVAYIWSLLGLLKRKASARSVYLGTHVFGWLLSWVLLRSVHGPIKRVSSLPRSRRWFRERSSFSPTRASTARSGSTLLSRIDAHMPLRFELVTPERLVRADDVHMVVVPGTEGDFGVLEGHAPFMSTMRPRRTRRLPHGRRGA
jgi:hypothetical protein